MWGMLRGRNRHRNRRRNRLNPGIRVSLDVLGPGQSALVLHINGSGPIRRRLLDLGFRSGEKITVVKTAPFRDPLEIELNSGHFTIRRSEAALVSVEVLGD